MYFIFKIIIRKKKIQKIAQYSCLIKPRCSHKKIEIFFYHVYNFSIETDKKNQQDEKICKRSLIIEKSKGITEISFRSFFQFLFLLYLLYLMRSTFILTGRATMTDCESTSGSWRLFTKIRACVSRGREAGSRTEDRAAVGRACGGSWMVAACQNRCRQGAEREDEVRLPAHARPCLRLRIPLSLSLCSFSLFAISSELLVARDLP